MENAIMVIVVMGVIGIFFGFILATANKKFSIKVNPLIHVVEEVLPKGQCGACGYAGCAAYAEAVVTKEEVPPNLCVPGKEAVAEQIAELTGKVSEKIEPRIAHIKCAGSPDKAKLSYEYKGVKDCVAANLLQGGPKACKNGCIGFGSCIAKCPFGALSMGENGIPVVDKDACTGCGSCESVCPKHVIEMISPNALVHVNCNSKEKGVAVKKNCTIGCIGCGLCAKNCTHAAIKIENNLAVVDTMICAKECKEATCLAKCPTQAITALIS